MRFPWLIAAVALPGWAAQPLQPLIDATPAGGVLVLGAGSYDGPALIDHPMVLDGNGAAVVRGGGRGTVLTVRTSGAVVRRLRITASGESNDGMDAGLALEGNGNRIVDNAIDDVLFGIRVAQGDANDIAGNRITGKDRPLGLRGDGLRLWNSRHNLVRGNRFERVRDLTFANSPDNVIRRNRLRDGRYAMHFVFSPRARVRHNDFSDTATGIVVLYSPGLVIEGNRIANVMTGGGAAVTFKDSGEALVAGNEIVHCAVGLEANTPLAADEVITARDNRFAHNIVGMYFYGEAGGHRIVGNRFDHNLNQVVVSAVGAGDANVWRDNYWSDYVGFDRDGDGVGDTPHEIYLYADRIWMEEPMATFFRNSPVFEMLDFLERLAPFAAPARILSDPRPRMR